MSMSFVNVAPQLVSTAAADVERIGTAINTNKQFHFNTFNPNI
ncbi:PE family protein, partial [Mycobacterium tuberculosis]